MRCRGVWGIWMIGVFGRYYGNSKGHMEGTPTWDNTYQLKLCMPPICCLMMLFGGLAHVGTVIELC